MQNIETSPNAASGLSAEAGEQETAPARYSALDQSQSASEESMLDAVMARLGNHHLHHGQDRESAQKAAW